MLRRYGRFKVSPYIYIGEPFKHMALKFIAGQIHIRKFVLKPEILDSCQKQKRRFVLVKIKEGTGTEESTEI